MASLWKPRLIIFPGLSRKPPVKKIARLTGLTTYDVAARLQEFWLEAQTRCDTAGVMAGKTAGWVDDLVEHPGFATAMAEAGWLVITPEALAIPKFDECISRAAVKRIEKSMAVATRRAEGTVPHAGDMRATCEHKSDSVPVVEPAKKAKRPAATKKAAVTDARFWRFWRSYPKKFNQPLAYEQWEALGPDDALVEVIVAAVADQLTSPQWRKDDGQFIPAPANWLRARGWENRVDPLPGGGVHRVGRVEPAAGEFDGRAIVIAGEAAAPAPPPKGGTPSLFG